MAENIEHHVYAIIFFLDEQHKNPQRKRILHSRAPK
jgi:hypothetical protein